MITDSLRSAGISQKKTDREHDPEQWHILHFRNKGHIRIVVRTRYPDFAPPSVIRMYDARKALL